jgi:hypothetical protein
MFYSKIRTTFFIDFFAISTYVPKILDNLSRIYYNLSGLVNRFTKLNNIINGG